MRMLFRRELAAPLFLRRCGNGAIAAAALVAVSMCLPSCGLEESGPRTELTYGIVAPRGGYISNAEMDDIADVVKERVELLRLRGARVTRTGSRIVVDIRGHSAAAAGKISAVITRTGRLEFRLVADEKINAAVIDEARKTGKAPDGWHWYTLERKDPDNPGKMMAEELLVSDSLARGRGLAGNGISRVSVGRRGAAGSGVAMYISFKDPDVLWLLTKNNIDRRVAIITDDVRDETGSLTNTGKVHSAPVIRQAILGEAEITGGFTPTEAEELAVVLQSGMLKAPLKLESMREYERE